MKKSVVSLFAGIIALGTIQTVNADSFSIGDLVVLQVGDGSAALSSAATAGFLKEFSTSGGAALQTISIPTTASGGQFASTFGGSTTSEGQLLQSADGQYLTFAGYNAAVGTAAPSGQTAATINRVIGVVGASGSLDTSTAISSGTSGNARSAISSNGTQLWLASSASGVGSVSLGGSAATQLSTTPANTRVLGISAGQLYVSASSGAFLGVSSIGSGEPTTSGQTTTALPGFPTTGSHSSYDFFFANATTLYVADDGSVANGGGIQKWAFSAGSWSLQYTLLNNGTTTTAVRSLAVDTSGANPIIYAITTAGTGSLISLTDTGAGSTATILATAPANTAFRGVAFAPTAVPEPATLALASLGGLACLFAIRRKR
ncbi:MAG TPA: PEP-CTERM sorting domain-containing protein [Verrucomicrobiae bacterium]|nr:PEP-CTERM sorting domain-containing protein [Verrucomicrobiae bacterium]